MLTVRFLSESSAKVMVPFLIKLKKKNKNKIPEARPKGPLIQHFYPCNGRDVNS